MVTEKTSHDENAAASRARLIVRMRGLIVLAVCLSIFVTAACLEPRPRGYGTHMSLGLSSCGFKARHGYPCPTCGMTTSVSAMVRFNIPLAWKAQPFGILFTFALLAGLVAGGMELFSCRDILSRPGLRWRWWIMATVLLLMTGWGLKVLTGILDGSYPESR